MLPFFSVAIGATFVFAKHDPVSLAIIAGIPTELAGCPANLFGQKSVGDPNATNWTNATTQR
jgi:hypothetical protein